MDHTRLLDPGRWSIVANRISFSSVALRLAVTSFPGPGTCVRRLSNDVALRLAISPSLSAQGRVLCTQEGHSKPLRSDTPKSGRLHLNTSKGRVRLVRAHDSERHVHMTTQDTPSLRTKVVLE